MYQPFSCPENEVLVDMKKLLDILDVADKRSKRVVPEKYFEMCNKSSTNDNCEGYVYPHLFVECLLGTKLDIRARYALRNNSLFKALRSAAHATKRTN